MTAGDAIIIVSTPPRKEPERVTATKAHLDGNKRHQAKLCRIIIQPYAAEGERIKAAASAAGESVQGYILTAVRDRMRREQADTDSRQD